MAEHIREALMDVHDSLESLRSADESISQMVVNIRYWLLAVEYAISNGEEADLQDGISILEKAIEKYAEAKVDDGKDTSLYDEAISYVISLWTSIKNAEDLPEGTHSLISRICTFLSLASRHTVVVDEDHEEGYNPALYLIDGVAMIVLLGSVFSLPFLLYGYMA